MRHISFRLKPGELLKESIERVVAENGILAGCVLSLVGSLDVTVLRMADATAGSQPVKKWHEPMEIVSGTGTVSTNGCHIHVSVADKNGVVHGGHLKDGCVVKFTVEASLLIFEDTQFIREFDAETGFSELRVGQD